MFATVEELTLLIHPMEKKILVFCITGNAH